MRLETSPIEIGIVDVTLRQKMQAFQAARQNHLGYPYNLKFSGALARQFGGFLVNNLGDPFVGSHYATECCDLEREVVTWFMNLWDCEDHHQFWGVVGASGTEGNIWALYLAREAHPTAIVLHGADAHYSIPKAARILRIESISVPSSADGSVSISALKAAIGEQNNRPVILALNCGSTVKGAHDNIREAIIALQSAGYDRSNSYIHVDGALNAMVLPFVREAPLDIKPSFRHAIDSISASGHKMVGTPMPCGVIIARKADVERVSSAISYLRTNDTTLMGSRNGHAVLALWERLHSHGRDGFVRDVYDCLQRARRLADLLIDAGVPVLLNHHAITVVFPEPSAAIVNHYQLACDGGMAHAVLMPNVSNELVERFVCSYLEWWSAAAQALSHINRPWSEVRHARVAGA